MIRDYKDLVVWQKAMDLVVEVYSLAKKLPKEETFVLSDQLRRAAVSIPSNIAEGNSRSSTKDYIRFLFIARGSTAEIETQLQICVRVNYFADSDIDSALNLCAELGKMLNVLIAKLTKRVEGN